MRTVKRYLQKLPQNTVLIGKEGKHNFCPSFPPIGRATAQMTLLDTNKSYLPISPKGAEGCT